MRPSLRRIGVLTFHRCINYGSYWQARCLVQGLRARGFDAVLLDHRSGQIALEEWRCGLRPVLPSRVPRRDYFYYGVKILKFHRAIASLPQSSPFPLEHPSHMEAFDLVIVGSDEVWNFRHPWYGHHPFFFGRGIRADRLVAHAASFGNYESSAGMAPQWASWLSGFEAISVRDQNSQHLIRAALGYAPDLVLDPCLQFPPGQAGNQHGRQRPYVVVYGHNFSAPFSRHVREWARVRRLRLVSIGYRNDWADQQWLTAGPNAFARAIAGASAVATNFFHGCVFALRYAIPFVCEGSDYRSTKLGDLMAAVGSHHRLVSGTALAGACDTLLGRPLEAGVLDRIATLRRRSDEYLERVLA